MSFGTSGMVGEWRADWLHNQGDLAYANSPQCQGNKRTERVGAQHADIGSASWWETEPNVGRVADGVAARMDRLKAIGNGQVPLCASIAWKILSELNEVNHDTR